MMIAYFWIALGGAIGSMARFWVSATMTTLTGPAFPWGTLLINVVGSFVIGVLAVHAHAGAHPHVGLSMVAFAMVGICGGFTTFSSFSLQTLDLARGGKLSHAAAYIGGSAVLCLIFVWLGTKL